MEEFFSFLLGPPSPPVLRLLSVGSGTHRVRVLKYAPGQVDGIGECPQGRCGEERVAVRATWEEEVSLSHYILLHT